MDERTAYKMIHEHLTSHLTDKETLECQKVIGEKRRMFLDFYLPSGCKSLELQGATAIEIKEKLVSDTIMRLSFAYDQSLISELILILLDEDEVTRLNSTLIRLRVGGLHGRRIKVLTLSSFLLEHETANYIECLKRKIAVQEEEKAREILLKEIKQKIYYNSYTLFFGAGVSCSAGLPGWDSLLKGILRKVIKQSGLSINVRDYSAINQHPYCSNSPLIMAQYLSSNLPEGALSKIVRQEIYKVTPSKFTLLDSLIELIHSRRPESVITYNYDDLFETRAEFFGINCHSIADDNRIDGDDLPVYHVHGVLPQHAATGKEETIVLDEKSYHTENKDSFLWSNIEQMHALRRTTCIFVGLSMTDPNLRRLLDISQRAYGDESTYHYAFLKKEALRPNESQKNSENQAIIEEMLRGLGVETVWYDDHNDLPILIKKLI